MDDKAIQARAQIKAVFDDKEAKINGRTYQFLRMTHKQRRKVFAFYSRIANRVQAGDFSFLDTPEFDAIEDIIASVVMYNDSLLCVLGDSHWDKYATDYVTFITTALPVISYPFFPDAPIDLASTLSRRVGAMSRSLIWTGIQRRSATWPGRDTAAWWN